MNPTTPGIDILNCGMGHNEITIDTANPESLQAGEAIIVDMLRRGYSIFLPDNDGKLTRVESFDPTRKVYVIGDGPQPKKRGRKKREVPIGEVRAVSIARTSGG